MQPKKHSLEFLRENAHLRVRTNAFGAIMRVRSVLSYAVHSYFQQKGFVYVNTPIITGSDAEGAGEMFKVTALPFDDTPRTEDGKVDYKEDFKLVEREDGTWLVDGHYSLHDFLNDLKSVPRGLPSRS